MSLHFSRHLKIAAGWVAIGLLGAGAGWLTYRSQETGRLDRLLNAAKLAAVSFPAAELQQRAGTREDLATPGYAELKGRLRRLKDVDSRYRFVYLFRFDPGTGKVTYLADSAEPGAKDESLPGDVYPQAGDSPGLQEIIRTGQPSCEGPLADDFGTWITGYAAVGTWTSAGGIAARHILGVDLDAADWRRALWFAGFEGAYFIWLLLGIPVGVWLIARRQREQREVIRNLSEAMEQSHSAIMIIDRGGHIEYANRGLTQQNGYSRRELFGRSWREFQGVDDAKTIVGEIAASIQAGIAWEGEWTSQRKDGTVFPVRGGFTPVKHRDGSIACFVAVFDDVTETKRREAELRAATELAQAGDRAKGQFLATMSHEVRTPLNGIVGFTSLLLETPLTAEQREYVQTVHMSTAALIQLTGDILDFARIESGKLKLDPTPCDPRECVEDSLDLLAAKAAEKDLVLLHHVGAGVPAGIFVDGGRLRQVLFNLIGNAVKFTARGEVEVTVALGPEPAAPAAAVEEGAPPAEFCSLVFTVRDTGIGIPAEHHDRLFRAFSQVDESTTRRFGGTGLGLAISQNLVGLMGGEIGVRSTPGEGSTFTFTIRVPVTSPPPAPPDLRGMRLLVVALPGAWRRELVGLIQGWRGEPIAVDTGDALPADNWNLAVVDLSAELSRELAGQPGPARGWVPEKMIGLVPISMANEIRTALRRHFRLLVNQPVRHDALFALLTGVPICAPQPAPAPASLGLRVLVAEDNAVNQRLIKRVLEHLGCRPSLVENGRQALEVLAARAAEFDLVLLDMHMPEMDGLETLQAIRAGQAGPQAQAIWIIALTADAREQQRAQGMAAGLNGYLTKPLNLGVLAAALGHFRDQRGGPQPGGAGTKSEGS